MTHLKLLKSFASNVTPLRNIPRATRISLFGIPRSVLRAAGMAATIASLSAYGYVSPQLPIAPPAPTVVLDRSSSWMSQDAAKVKSLLYVRF
jgi:hypothetical protein